MGGHTDRHTQTHTKFLSIEGSRYADRPKIDIILFFRKAMSR